MTDLWITNLIGRPTVSILRKELSQNEHISPKGTIWILLSGTIFHATGTASSLTAERSKGTFRHYRKEIASTEATGYKNLDLHELVIIDSEDRILLSGAASVKAFIKILEYIPVFLLQDLKTRIEPKGFWVALSGDK